MESHRYTVGARVRVTLHHDPLGSRLDVYTVSRLLPSDARMCQYRVKRIPDGQERLVREDQLTIVN